MHKALNLSRCAIPRVPVASICDVISYAVVAVAAVVVGIAIEGPPSHKILQVYGRTADALLVKGLYVV